MVAIVGGNPYTTYIDGLKADKGRCDNSFTPYPENIYYHRVATFKISEDQYMLVCGGCITSNGKCEGKSE